MHFKAVAGLGLVLLTAAPVNAPIPMEASLTVADRITPVGLEMMRLYNARKFDNVLSLGRRRPEDCYAERYVVLAAYETGGLPALDAELDDALRGEPQNGYLTLAAGLAARYERRDAKAYERLERAIALDVPCSEAYVSFVEVARRLGRLADASQFLREKSREDGRNALHTFGLAFLLDSSGDNVGALRAYEAALWSSPTVALAYLHKARLLLDMGRFDLVASSARVGGMVAAQTGQVDVLAELKAAAGFALEQQGRGEESEKEFEEALALARRYGLVEVEARLHFYQTILLATVGKPERLSAHLEAGRRLEAELPSRAARAVYFNRLGRVFATMGLQQEEERALRESVRLAREERAPLLEQEGELGLARIALDRGFASQAIESLEKALRVAEAMEDGQLRARVLTALADSHERMGSYPRALSYYQEAYRLADAGADRRAQAVVLGNIGIVLFRLGRPDEAVVYSARAADMARETRDLQLESGFLQGLAASLTGLERYQQSEQVYRAALAAASRLGSPGRQAVALAGLARVVLIRGRTEEAERSFEQALALSRTAGDSLVEWQSVAGLAACARARGDFERASTLFSEAIALIESTRAGIGTESGRMSYLETRADIYRNLASLLTEREALEPGRGHGERAFEIHEQARARAILDILRAFSERGKTDAAMRLHELRSTVLKPGEVLLEFQLGEPKSLVWVVSRDRFEALELSSRQKIEEATGRFLETLTSPPRVPQNPFVQHLTDGRALFDLLLGPVRARISGAKLILIAADGALHHLPFEALVLDVSAESPRYLLDVAPVAYVPSAAVLRTLRSRRGFESSSRSFFGVAQPDGTHARPEPLRSIPFAAKEVESLAALYTSSQKKTLLGPQATERAVRESPLRRFRTLHFAAHAVVDEIAPERSALILAPDDGQPDPQGVGSHGRGNTYDGMLEMSEVLSLSLDSDLVVLSACQTGLGRLLRTEGTVGFTWSFLSAGSRSVVVSYWNVNDRSTAEVMVSFYRHMERGLSKAEALREAKRDLVRSPREAFRHPYFWATFVLVGRPD